MQKKRARRDRYKAVDDKQTNKMKINFKIYIILIFLRVCKHAYSGVYLYKQNKIDNKWSSNLVKCDLDYINVTSLSIKMQPGNRCNHCNTERLLKHFPLCSQ